MRTFGAVDKRQRKHRSDRGKKRERYAGKKTKPRKRVNGNLKPYVPRRKYEDPIHIIFWKIDDMYKESYMHFEKNSRRHIRPTVYGRGAGRVHAYIDPMEINNKEKLGAFCLERLWTGKWLIRLCGNAKTVTHSTFRAVAVAVIKENSSGNTVKIHTSYTTSKGATRSIARTWFWEGER